MGQPQDNTENDFLLDVPVTTAEAKVLEAAGFRTTLPVPASQISEDLRKEIIRIITVGDDKKKGAFTVSVATHLERLIQAAKQILMAEKISNNDVGGLLKMKNQSQMSSPYGSQDFDSEESMGMSAPFIGNGGKTNENFGVQAIKEIIAAAKSIHDSPAKDVEALAVARREGLMDIAASLEAKLGIHKTLEPKREEPK